MEKDFKTLQELYNKLLTLSNEYELDFFKNWCSKSGVDYITIRLKKKTKQLKPEDVKGILV